MLNPRLSPKGSPTGAPRSEAAGAGTGIGDEIEIGAAIETMTATGIETGNPRRFRRLPRIRNFP